MGKTADKTQYKPRVIDGAVQKYLDTFGAVCIEGPKWCGKNTDVFLSQQQRVHDK